MVTPVVDIIVTILVGSAKIKFQLQAVETYQNNEFAGLARSFIQFSPMRLALGKMALPGPIRLGIVYGVRFFHGCCLERNLSQAIAIKFGFDSASHEIHGTLYHNCANCSARL